AGDADPDGRGRLPRRLEALRRRRRAGVVVVMAQRGATLVILLGCVAIAGAAEAQERPPIENASESITPGAETTPRRPGEPGPGGAPDGGEGVPVQPRVRYPGGPNTDQEVRRVTRYLQESQSGVPLYLVFEIGRASCRESAGLWVA